MVDVEREGPIARIFLNRPEKANALNSEMLRALANAVRGLAGDESLRIMLLGGRGRTFCGGADREELKSLTASTAGAFVERIHDVCQAIRDLPVPVVARLHGAVIGAGLEIAAACDLRVAWLVLTGEAIDARRALEWGLIEEVGDGEALLKHLLAGDREALRVQKQLLQLWDEASLATSVAASVERFARIHTTMPSGLRAQKD